MNTVDLPLRDIHLPDPVNWWPPALGWWLLVFLLPVLLFLLIRLFKFFTRKTALKKAKKLLTDIKNDTVQSDFEKLSQLSVLIRRMAISCFPRSEVAGLTGSRWLEFLDRSVKGQPFSLGVGKQLIELPYRDPSVEVENLSALIKLCEAWLKAVKKS